LSSTKIVELLYLSFYPSFLRFSSFHRLDLLSATSTPWVAVVLAYLPSRCRLARGKAPSSSVGGAPDYHRSRRNQIIRFAKPNNLIFSVSSRSFRPLSDLCVNTYWWLHWGIDLLQPWLIMGWRSTTTYHVIHLYQPRGMIHKLFACW
jgi:hypothetical protein